MPSSYKFSGGPRFGKGALLPLKAKAVRKIVQKEINKNSETKQRAVSLTNTYGVTTIVSLLNSIPQGVDQGERIGNQIRMTGLFIHGTWSVADTYNRVRVVIYTPRDPTVSLTALTMDQIIDQDQITVHKDFYVNLVADASNQISTMKVRIKFPGRGRIVQYADATSTSYQKNALKMSIVSDSAFLPSPKFMGYYRIYYKDD